MPKTDPIKKLLDKPEIVLVYTGVSEEYLNELVQLRRQQQSALAELERFLRKHGKIVKSPN
jgi:hypothetical protein